MKTLSFIGSDKNAGKTTALNFVHQRLSEELRGSGSVCLTSIGINGEEVDAYEDRAKPLVPQYRGSYFVTAGEQLSRLSGSYEVLHTFAAPEFKKTYVLGKCLFDFPLVLEGPNEKREILRMKTVLETLLPNPHLLIDGSIDRQFLAHPRISDEICYAVLASGRKEQLQKARDLLFALSIPDCDQEMKALLSECLAEETRSLLLDEEMRVLYRGEEIPFLDEALKTRCIAQQNSICHLYLNGALTRSMFDFLAPLRNLRIILDNFTLYQNVSVHKHPGRTFRPQLTLYHPVLVKKIFLKQETSQSLDLPENIPVHNLFGEKIHEIGI